jgi:hypothetical protein
MSDADFAKLGLLVKSGAPPPVTPTFTDTELNQRGYSVQSGAPPQRTPSQIIADNNPYRSNSNDPIAGNTPHGMTPSTAGGGIPWASNNSEASRMATQFQSNVNNEVRQVHQPKIAGHHVSAGLPSFGEVATDIINDFKPGSTHPETIAGYTMDVPSVPPIVKGIEGLGTGALNLAGSITSDAIDTAMRGKSIVYPGAFNGPTKKPIETGGVLHALMGLESIYRTQRGELPTQDITPELSQAHLKGDVAPLAGAEPGGVLYNATSRIGQSADAGVLQAIKAGGRSINGTYGQEYRADPAGFLANTGMVVGGSALGAALRIMDAPAALNRTIITNNAQINALRAAGDTESLAKAQLLVDTNNRLQFLASSGIPNLKGKLLRAFSTKGERTTIEPESGVAPEADPINKPLVLPNSTIASSATTIHVNPTWYKAPLNGIHSLPEGVEVYKSVRNADGSVSQQLSHELTQNTEQVLGISKTTAPPLKTSSVAAMQEAEAKANVPEAPKPINSLGSVLKATKERAQGIQSAKEAAQAASNTALGASAAEHTNDPLSAFEPSQAAANNLDDAFSNPDSVLVSHAKFAASNGKPVQITSTADIANALVESGIPQDGARAVSTLVDAYLNTRAAKTGESPSQYLEANLRGVVPGETLTAKTTEGQQLVDNINNAVKEHAAQPQTDDLFADSTASKHEVASGQPVAAFANVPTSSIQVDPDRFQYKIIKGHGGQTGSLSSVKSWNPNSAGALQVWRDPADGQTYAVNGHNRLALANRLGVKNVNVQYLDAATPGEARAHGALVNIAEGQGTAVDAAQFFRDSKMTPQEISDQGIPLKGKVAEQGIALSQLHPSIFSKVVRGEIPAERASIIGSKLPNPDDQLLLTRRMDDLEKSGKEPTNGQISEMADSIAGAPRGAAGVSTPNMFGDDATPADKSLFFERASVADYIRRQLGRTANVLKTAGNTANAEAFATGKNVIDAETSAQKAHETNQAQEIFDRTKNSSGPVSDILDEASRRLGKGESPNVVKQDALNKFRTAAPDIIRSLGQRTTGDTATTAAAGEPVGEGAAIHPQSAAGAMGTAGTVIPTEEEDHVTGQLFQRAPTGSLFGDDNVEDFRLQPPTEKPTANTKAIPNGVTGRLQFEDEVHPFQSDERIPQTIRDVIGNAERQSDGSLSASGNVKNAARAKINGKWVNYGAQMTVSDMEKAAANGHGQVLHGANGDITYNLVDGDHHLTAIVSPDGKTRVYVRSNVGAAEPNSGFSGTLFQKSPFGEGEDHYVPGLGGVTFITDSLGNHRIRNGESLNMPISQDVRNILIPKQITEWSQDPRGYIADRLGKLYDLAVGQKGKSGVSSKNAKMPIAIVDHELANRIRGAVGLETEGSTLVADTSTVHHSNKGGPNRGVEDEHEENRVHMTREDFTHIYDVIKDADTIEKGKNTVQGGTVPAIVFKKQIGKRIEIVTGVSEGKKLVFTATVKAYDEGTSAPKQRATSKTEGVAHTSTDDGSARSSSLANPDIPQSDEKLFQKPSQVNTPQFKKWFLRSRIVDDQQQPKVMYHGTGGARHSEFDTTNYAGDNHLLYGSGAYFTDSPKTASGYAETTKGSITSADKAAYYSEGRIVRSYGGFDKIVKGYDPKTGYVTGVRVNRDGSPIAGEKPRTYGVSIDNENTNDIKQALGKGKGVYPVHLSIKNPFDIDKSIGLDGAKSIVKALKEKGLPESLLYDNNISPLSTGKDLYKVLCRHLGDKWDVREVLEKAGYDGITHIGGSITGGEPHNVAIAFNGTQIKSAIGNNGNFDPNDPNILHQSAPFNKPYDYADKFTPEALDWASSKKFGDVESPRTLGDYLKGPKIRELFKDVLNTRITNLPNEDPVLRGAYGLYDHNWKDITTAHDMDEHGPLHTILHEAAHALQDKKGRLTDEGAQHLYNGDYNAYRNSPNEVNARKLADYAYYHLQEDGKPLFQKGSEPAAGAGPSEIIDAIKGNKYSQLGPDGEKGSIQWSRKDGQALIKLYQSADVSTAAHEFAHFFRKSLTPDLLARAEDYYGIKNGEWTTDHEENFARDFEAYLANGKAPRPQLQEVFDNFKGWLTDIYKNTIDSPIAGELHPTMKTLFDDMLGGKGHESITGEPTSDSPLASSPVMAGGSGAKSPMFNWKFGTPNLQDLANAVRNAKPAVRNTFDAAGSYLKKHASPETTSRFQELGAVTARTNVLMKHAMGDVVHALGTSADLDRFGKVLTESRLRGVRARWQSLTANARAANPEDLVTRDNKGTIVALDDKYAEPIEALGSGGGRWSNIAAQLHSQIEYANETGDLTHLNNFVASTMNRASKNVPTMFGNPLHYDNTVNDPKFKTALQIYKDRIEPHIAESHASNEGVFSQDLGPLKTYYPLSVFKQDGSLRPVGTPSPAMEPAENIHNRFATGQAEQYDSTPGALASKVSGLLRRNSQAAFVRGIVNDGLTVDPSDEAQMQRITTVSKKDQYGNSHDQATIDVGGVKYPASLAAIEYGGRKVGADGVPFSTKGKSVYVPNWLKKESGPVLTHDYERWGSDDDTPENILSRAATTISLAAPQAGVAHVFNLSYGFIKSAGPNLVHILGGECGVQNMAKRFAQVANNDPDRNAVALQEMARSGALSDRYGSLTNDPKVAELLGTKPVSGVTVGNTRLATNPKFLLFGDRGMDVRTRIALYRSAKAMVGLDPDAPLPTNPNGSYQDPEMAAQLAKYVTDTVGQYNRVLQNSVVRGLVKHPLGNPFAVAGTTFMKQGIEANTRFWDVNTLPTKGVALGRQVANKMFEQAIAGPVALIGTWAALYAIQTGHLPFDDKKSRFLTVPVGTDTRLGKAFPGVSDVIGKLENAQKGQEPGVSTAIMNPTVSRGLNALGVRNAYNAYQEGATPGMVGEEALRGQINGLSQPFTSGPLLNDILAAGGITPYLSSLRDRSSGQNVPQFEHTLPPSEPGYANQVENRALSVAATANPVAGALLGKAGYGSNADYTPKGQSPMSGSAQFAKNIVNTFLPRGLTQPATDMTGLGLADTAAAAHKAVIQPGVNATIQDIVQRHQKGEDVSAEAGQLIRSGHASKMQIEDSLRDAVSNPVVTKFRELPLAAEQTFYQNASTQDQQLLKPYLEQKLQRSPIALTPEQQAIIDRNAPGQGTSYASASPAAVNAEMRTAPQPAQMIQAVNALPISQVLQAYQQQPVQLRQTWRPFIMQRVLAAIRSREATPADAMLANRLGIMGQLSRPK